ncbi:MAG: hypothetical protein QOI74_2423 [Micromonosporaceae bacterium]|jgi:uncharacterized protein with FMN-binding domain|nr:hypothetical protein [Micromonosporaceae bacterium]MDT5038193.1 hypothetical protein [Micromonosporaceae bacterium]
MRKITMWFVSTVAAVVLLFSYRTSTMGPASAGGSTAAAGAPGVVSGGDPAATNQTATTDTVVNGSVAQTRWGPVQVQVHISNNKITGATTLQVPDGNRRDKEINSYAVPRLNDEVLAAQSAHIDTVSGATVTSDGYLESLQAALDAAHLPG